MSHEPGLYLQRICDLPVLTEYMKNLNCTEAQPKNRRNLLEGEISIAYNLGKC